MGCCLSKKKKAQKAAAIVPLVVQKNMQRYPEQTEETQNDNMQPETVQTTEKSIISIATEPGLRSLRKGKNASAEPQDALDDIESEMPAKASKKSKRAKKATVLSSSSEALSQSQTKDKNLFPEDTGSTQHSDKGSKANAKTNTTQSGSKKQISREDFIETTDRTQYEASDNVY